MDFEKSSGLIYKMASKRVKYKKKYLKKSSFNLAGYESEVNFKVLTELEKYEEDPSTLTNLDPYMFNKISCGYRSPNNKFFITDKYIPPLCKHLKFTEHNLLFGTLEEINDYAGEFYYLLFLDILDMKKNPLKQLLTIVLMDYVQFSKVESYKNLVEDSIKNCDGYKEGSLETFYSLIDDYHKPLSPKDRKNKKTIENIIEETSNELIVDIMYSLKEYGLIEFIDYKEIGIDIIASSTKIFNLRKQYNQSKKTAIGRFFSMNNKKLIDVLVDFSYETDSFKKLPKKIDTYFTREVSKLIENIIGKNKLTIDEYKENSYGYRVHKIINSDIRELYSNISLHKGEGDRLEVEPIDELEYKNEIANEQRILEIYTGQLERVKEYIDTLHHIQWRKDKGLSANSSICLQEKYYRNALINTWEDEFKSKNIR